MTAVEIDPAAPPTRGELFALTPAAGIRPRPHRYVGDTVFAAMHELAGDAAVVRRLYAFLQAILAAVQRPDAPEALPELGRLVVRSDYRALCEEIGRLGAALSAEDTPMALRKVYHDVRGGSLNALLMHLDLVDAGEAGEADVERVFILVRDHLKIMRNALPDLDVDGYQADLSPRVHDASLLVQKWTDTRYGVGGASRVQVRMRCDFAGGVSECCMEFAALDRVFYNLINNAARFAADGQVRVDVLALDDGPQTNIRVAVSNRVSADHRERLNADLSGDLGRIFAGGYTTGGHGVGLQICSDIISHGYGLGSASAAVSGGYLGARLVRDHFVAWFHWPAQRAKSLSGV